MVRGMGYGGAAGHIGPALQRYIFVGQGPCALPDVRTPGGRPCPPGAVGSMWRVGEGLCLSRGRGRTLPLRRMWWCAGGFIVYIRGGLW